MAAAEQAVATETQSSERSIRDELLAAREEVESRNQAEEAPAAEAPVEAEESGNGRARDERGRFAPVVAEGEPVQPEADQPAASATEQPVVPVAAPEAAAPSVIAAPPAWSNAAKAKWNELPTEIRAEIAKREADVHKGFTKMDEERAFGRELQKVVGPYEPLIRSEGGTPAAAVQDLLNTAYILRTADPQTKARLVAETCQRFGVDLSLLGQAQQQPSDPQVASLQQELAQLHGFMQQQQQSEQARVQQEALQTVEAFKTNPEHPYFDAVQGRMAELLTSGAAKDLSQAYETAVWERPDLRQQLLAKTAQPQTQQVSRQKAERARTKAVSVRGGAGGYQPPPANPNASVREDLMAAMEEARGRI